MRLFSRILLSHLTAILVAGIGVAVIAGIISPGIYRAHLDRIAIFAGPEIVRLRVALEVGYQDTMLTALAIALPVSLLFAVGTAYLITRRITTAVQKLAEGSREIAHGRYSKRLETAGKDELGEIALHFNRMANALEEAEKSRVELIGTVAHELSTPLATLQGHAEALMDGMMPPEEVAQAVTREMNAMRRLSHDLLLLTKVEAAALELHPAAHETCDLIAEVQDRFMHVFEEKGLALRIEASQDLPAVYADRERVGQVLGNLLSNALRYTPEGGQVVLGMQAGQDAIQFSVADNGPGISPEHQMHIFRRFYRVDASRSRADGGTGIGLTVARGLVEAMGGRMWLESEVGRGTTFYFTLPVAVGARA